MVTREREKLLFFAEIPEKIHTSEAHILPGKAAFFGSLWVYLCQGPQTACAPI